MIRGIRSRVWLTYFAVIMIALITFGIYIMQFLEGIYVDTLKSHLRQEAQIVASFLPMTGSQQAALQRMQSYRNTKDEEITLLDRNGIVLASTSNEERPGTSHAKDPEVGSALHTNYGEDTRMHPVLQEDALFVAVPIFDGTQKIGIVQISTSLTSIHNQLTKIWEWMGSGIALVAALTLLISWRIAYMIAKPIEDITNVAQEVEAGNLSKRVRFRGTGEMAALANAVNHMAARLSEQLETVTYEKTKLESILSSMLAGVIVVDRSGRITYANTAVTQMMGYSTEYLKNRWHWEVGHNYGLSSLVDDALLFSHTHKCEIYLHNPADRTVEVHITPISDPFQNVIAAVIVLHDVSEWRRMERMRSEFVANVSHELRTPITAVKGFAETLLDGALQDPETAESFVKIINDESERMSRLIADLLDLSRIESKQKILDKIDADLEEIVTSSIVKLHHHAEKAGVELVYDEPQKRAQNAEREQTDLSDSVEKWDRNRASMPVQVDPDRISQVIINLVSNAIAYTPQGGSIHVSIDCQPDCYTVHIRDTGIGIPPEDIPRLFERFYRVDKTRSRRSGGTGLGLAIVKHIIDVHGGKVQVESEVGRGSDFSFTIPRTGTNVINDINVRN